MKSRIKIIFWVIFLVGATYIWTRDHAQEEAIKAGAGHYELVDGGPRMAFKWGKKSE